MSKVEFTIADANGTDYIYDLEVRIKIAPAEREIGIPDPYVDEAYIESGTLQICEYSTGKDYKNDDVTANNLHLPASMYQEFYETLTEESFKVAKAEAENND